MIKKLLGIDFKYENDKMYRFLKTKWNCVSNNKPNKGYIRIEINKKTYMLHRLIYLYHNPEWDIHDISTDNSIDHINIKPSNNNIENLRVLDASGQGYNQNKRPNCSSKYRGVSWNKRDKKWEVTIRVKGKLIHLGFFEDEIMASTVYNQALEIIMETY